MKKYKMKTLIIILMSILLLGLKVKTHIKKNISSQWNFQEARRFDFWIGEWKVVNRYKQDDNSWEEEGKGHLKVWPVLDGKAIMEFWDGKGRNEKNVIGFSLRYFDKNRKEWIACLNWPSPNNGGFFFLSGKFRFNRCEIFNRRPLKNDQYIINRYTFCDITDTSYRWHDNTSLDSGKTWGSNWIMENHRLKELPEWPNPNEKFFTYNSDSYSKTEECRRFHFLEGNWKGEIKDSTAEGWKKDNVEITFWKVHNGVSMFYDLKSKSGFKEVGMLTYREQNDLWLSMRLDNGEESGIITKFWKTNDSEIKFSEYTQLFNKSTAEITDWKFENEDHIEISRFVKADETGEKLTSSKISLNKIN